MPYALVVDPDPIRLSDYRHLVESLGFVCIEASDGALASAALLANGPPGLVIAELGLPKKDGFAVLREVRGLATPAQAPVIAVSAFRELRNTAVQLKDELGITALLAKSAPMSSVHRAVEAALAQRAQPAPEPERASADEAERERERLEVLAAMGLETEPLDDRLQQLVGETARDFGVPISLVTLVTQDKQWFKAHVGLTGALLANRGTPRDWSFCQHVVQGNAPLVIPDAAVHPAFARNPLVRDGSVRSYAGAPLVTPRGEVLGSLCIIDTRPLAIGAKDVEALVVRARAVAGELELISARRRQAAKAARRSSGELPAVAAVPPPEPAAPPAAEPHADLALDAALPVVEAVLDHLDVGVVLMSSGHVVLYANEAFTTYFGVPHEALVGTAYGALQQLVANRFEDPAAFLRTVTAPESGPFAANDLLELARPRRRVLRWTTQPMPLGGDVAQLATYTDVTREVDAARAGENLIRVDALTGLANRRGGEDAITRELSRAARTKAPLSFAAFDVDGLFKVNDAGGTEAGDDCLRALARIFREAVRGSDLAVRWAGDELVAVLPGVALDGARAVAERIRACAEALPHGDHPPVTLSAGVAELRAGERFEDALARAGSALGEAKRAGGNAVR